MLTKEEVVAYHDDLLSKNLSEELNDSAVAYSTLKHAGMLYRYTADEGFNGAAGFTPLKDEQRQSKCYPAICYSFNGAAGFTPLKGRACKLLTGNSPQTSLRARPMNI